MAAAFLCPAHDPGMTKQKLTLTHPDGTVSTRGTVRAYTHAVVLTPREPQTWRMFVVKTLDARLALLADLNKRIAAGVVHPARPQNTGSLRLSSYMTHTAHFGMPQASTLTVWCDSEGMTRDYQGGGEIIRPAADVLLDQARSTVELWSDMNDEDRQLIASIDAGTADLGGYRVVRWSTRRGLAESAVSKFDGFREHGHSIEIQPVDPAVA